MTDTPQQTPEGAVDYAAMSPGEMYQYLGKDAERWTGAFMQLTGGTVDAEMMFAWVCNIMMAAIDFQHGQPILCGDHAQFLLDNDVAPPQAPGEA